MATPYVGQVPMRDKQSESTRMRTKDIIKPPLSLDLRFEQTYLKSIAPHVRLTTPASDESEKRGDLVRPEVRQLDIAWGKVIWITTKDQVFTPLLQGMMWGTLSPWVQYFRGDSAPSPGKGRTSMTGAGIAKLQSWLSAIIPPTATASFRTK